MSSQNTFLTYTLEDFHKLQEENMRLRNENRILSIDSHKNKILFREYVKIKTGYTILPATNYIKDISCHLAQTVIKFYNASPNYDRVLMISLII